MIWREKLRSIKADVGLLMCGFTGGVTQTHILIIMGSSSLGLFFLLSSHLLNRTAKCRRRLQTKLANFLTSSLEEYLVVLRKTGRSVLIYEFFLIIQSRLYFFLGTILYLYQLENSDSKFQFIISEDDL